ncbi:type III-B CRISPR module RAMP protein Cmr6 [Peptococcaceae bacterium 1198_IL3148]
MALPLYRQSDVPTTRSKGANAGLWYDKFCNQWQRDWTLDANGKHHWIKTVTESGSLGDAKLVNEMKERLLNLTNRLNGRSLFLKTDGRFVTGIGREHPVENGFTWHHTLGVPYLPGSSIKGMVRTWAKIWLNADSANRIFGADGKEGHEVGSVIFFDALPIKPIKLEIDIMTPHYSEYYQKEQENNPPADWYKPIPIPFLTVAGEQTFIFCLAPRRAESVEDQEDVKTAIGWLEEALSYIGAGAKTSAGYGRFIVDADAEKAWRKQQEEEKIAREKQRQEYEKLKKLASMSPLQQEMEADGYSDDTSLFKGKINNWLDKMEKADNKVGLEIAELLLKWYQEKEPEQLTKPNKKNKDKIARIALYLNKK